LPGSLHGACDGFDAFADEQGRAGLNIVGQKDDAAFVGPERATLICFVDRGLAFAVGGKIRELETRLGSADHLRDQGGEFLFELRMVSGRMETQRSGPRSEANPAAIEIDLGQRAVDRRRL
jgi:hypothetical protein